MINFVLPGVYEHFELNYIFAEYLQKNPEQFYPNVQIETFYGNFQDCIFDGGRIFFEHHAARKEEVEFIVSKFNNLNIPVRLIFTNNQLKETDFYDRFSNMVLKVCHNGKNEITIADPKLQEYIIENYPNFKLISSTTKCLTDFEDVKQELNNPIYKQVCWDYNLNKNKKFIESLTKEEIEKSELLINAICPPGCTFRKEHYRLNSLFSLNYGKPYRTQDCAISHNTLYPNSNIHNNLTPEEIYNDYVPKGFCHFKIEGRTLPAIEVLCNYVKYMAKPEYQFFIISEVWRERERVLKEQNNIFGQNGSNT